MYSMKIYCYIPFSGKWGNGEKASVVYIGGLHVW